MEAVSKMHSFFLSNKIAKETVWSFLAKGIAFIFFYLFLVYISRRLGVELFGRWSFFYSILTILFVVSYFGINPSTKVFLARSKSTEEVKHRLISSLFLRMTISVIFVFFYAIILIYLNSSHIYDLKFLFMLSLPFIFFKSIVEYFRNVFQGIHRIKYHFYINSCEYGLNLVFVIFFLNFFGGLKSVIMSLTLSVLISSFLGLYLISNYICLTFYSKSIYDTARRIFRYALPLTFISFGFLLITEIDIVMLGWIKDTHEVGIYAISKNVVNKLPQIAFAITVAVMPSFAKIDINTINKYIFKYKKLLKINFFIYVLISGLIIILAPWFVPLLFGSEYHGSILPLQILSVWLFIVSFNVIFNSFLDFQKKAQKRALHFLITIIINIFANLALIPALSSLGAAIATTSSYVIYVILNGIEVYKTFRTYKTQVDNINFE